MSGPWWSATSPAPRVVGVRAGAPGLRLAPRNDLTEAITAELADPRPGGRADGGMNSAKAVRAHYDWDAATDQLIEGVPACRPPVTSSRGFAGMAHRTRG